jgi:hypothetical protein
MDPQSAVAAKVFGFSVLAGVCGDSALAVEKEEEEVAEARQTKMTLCRWSRGQGRRLRIWRLWVCVAS